MALLLRTRPPVRCAGSMSLLQELLDKEEIEALNLIVSAYLDFAELQAWSRRPMHMADWIAKLDDFLKLSDRDILTHAGKVSHELAQEHANGQFAYYDERRRQLEARQATRDLEEAVDRAKRLGESSLPKARKPGRRNKGSDL